MSVIHFPYRPLEHCVDVAIIAAERRILQEISKEYQTAKTVKERVKIITRLFQNFVVKSYLLYEMPSVHQTLLEKIQEFSQRYQLYSNYIRAVMVGEDPVYLRKEYEWAVNATEGMSIKQKLDLYTDFITLRGHMKTVISTIESIHTQ